MHLADASPSSSRAHSPSAWHTADRGRCIAGRPSYAAHSSVFTCVVGSVARLTTRSSVGPSEFPTTVSLTAPLSRPATPQTGGRSLAYVPWPRRLFARRRGGSPGSRCGSPFFPRVLVRLIRLDVGVLQGVEVAESVGQVLELVAEPQELEPVAPQLAGQPCRRRALGEAAEDQQ
jgi:hypothetical protein